MTTENRERIIRAIGLIEGVGCCVDQQASIGLTLACDYLHDVLNSYENYPVMPARQEAENDG